MRQVIRSCNVVVVVGGIFLSEAKCLLLQVVQILYLFFWFFYLFRGLVGFKTGGTPKQTCCSILRTIIVNCLYSGHIQKVMTPFSVSPTKSS